MRTLARGFKEKLAAGGKLLVPYVVAGYPQPEGFTALARTLAALADALEIGLPYGDAVMDGPVLVRAQAEAIKQGTGPLKALDLFQPEPGPPRLAMTYYNPIHSLGEQEFCSRARKRGFSGLIVPDLPLEESASLRRAAASEELGWVPLIAPNTPPSRVARIAETATGFVYATSRLGVTGERASLEETAAKVVGACRGATDLPVLLGIGISTPEQARQAAELADGVIIGSAVVRLLGEQGRDKACSFLRDVRRALAG